MTAHTLDRQKLDSVLEPIARAHHAEVFDVEFQTERGGWVLRILVEKAGSAAARASTEDAAIDLELCVAIAKDLSTALDVADIIPHRYILEVSSPGVERELRNVGDFLRFSGKKAKLRLREPVDGQKVLVGIMTANDNAESNAEGRLTVADGKRKYEVTVSNVEHAHLVFEFGTHPASKTGDRKKR